uniref:conjugal transfer protein TraP n=1 Tax=Cronobacter sakazakii TaxID=28141 RepID=UPI00294B64D4
MTKNFIRIAIYGWTWCSWAIRNLIFFPAATLTLIIAFLMVLDHSSPGQIMVRIMQSADKVTDGVNWTWRECPSVSSNSNVFPPEPSIRPSALEANCPEMVSDARGYAEHIDRNFMPLVWIWWTIMAAISVTVERFPLFKHRTRLQMRTITTREQ